MTDVSYLALIFMKSFGHVKGRVAAPNQMNFRKSATPGAGRVIFNPKFYVADFGNLKQGFLSVKLIQKE